MDAPPRRPAPAAPRRPAPAARIRHPVAPLRALARRRFRATHKRCLRA
jgi:hypothetical protein